MLLSVCARRMRPHGSSIAGRKRLSARIVREDHRIALRIDNTRDISVRILVDDGIEARRNADSVYSDISPLDCTVLGRRTIGTYEFEA